MGESLSLLRCPTPGPCARRYNAASGARRFCERRAVGEIAVGSLAHAGDLVGEHVGIRSTIHGRTEEHEPDFGVAQSQPMLQPSVQARIAEELQQPLARCAREARVVLATELRSGRRRSSKRAWTHSNSGDRFMSTRTLIVMSCRAALRVPPIAKKHTPT